MVEFILTLDVENLNNHDYQVFIRSLRIRLEVRSSHNRPVLAAQRDLHFGLFDLVLQTSNRSVRFRFRTDNLFLLGYQMQNGQWLEFGRVGDQHLIGEPGTSFLGFDGNYNSLERSGDRRLDKTPVGRQNLKYAVNELATTTQGQNRACNLVIVIMMICESTRFIPVLNFMASSSALIPDWVEILVRNWHTMSAALLRADAYPQERFLRFGDDSQIVVQPNSRQIRSIEDIAEIIGILLGLCFYPGPQNRVDLSDSYEGCYYGIPLVQVFSVRINNIDGESSGELFGTITINNGLYTQYIYNRARENYEIIDPGENATLNGPSKAVTAFGSFTIKLLLTDKDAISKDDVIMDQVIFWDSFNILNEYDKLISKKLDASQGSVTVNYAVLKNAVTATITVTLVEGGEAKAEVYGQVYVSYSKWENPDAKCFLFNRPPLNIVKVSRSQNIPLTRTVVAVPLGNFLKVTVNLWDRDFFSYDLIANGTVELAVPYRLPFTTVNRIYGNDGNSVAVTVCWSYGF